MSFCKSAMKAIKKVWDEVTPELGEIISEITTLTGAIKLLGASPAVSAILALLHVDNEHVQIWIDKAIAEITGVTDTAKSLADKITDLINSAPTEAARNAILLKIAALATKTADPEPSPTKGESFYDSAVQLRIIADKHA